MQSRYPVATPLAVPTAVDVALVFVVWWKVASAVDVDTAVSSVLVGMKALKVAFANIAFHMASHAVFTDASELDDDAMAFTDHGKAAWSVPPACSMKLVIAPLPLDI
jgi:hypothetical protein